MKIAVLGAGVVGTTCAYFLAEDGHTVTVYDRQPEPAMETSFANGAQISACHAKPWAAPGVPMQALRWMFEPDAPFLLKPWRLDPALWSWGLKFLRNCTSAREHINMERTLRVSLYSRAVLKALRQRTNLQYNQVTEGILHIYRTPEEFDEGRKLGAALDTLGLPQDVLTAAECVKIEPALAFAASHNDLVGGLLSPEDESGDARQFTREIAKLGRARGVTFRHGVSVERLETERRRIARIITDHGDDTPDAVVLAFGSFSVKLAKTIGIDLPVYPAKGYSISVALTNPSAAPTISITDESRYMVFSRLGNVMRVAGTAELAGWNTRLDQVRVEPLRRNAQSLFPDAARYDELHAWCGLRPTTPDSVPILGPTKYENLLLNTGHGTLGWTMACGSARVIADEIAGRTPEIDVTGLDISRFG